MDGLTLVPGFDLQLFADGADGADGAEGGKETGGNPDGDKGTPDGKKTDDGGDKKSQPDEAALQSKIDEAVARAQKKWEKDYQKRMEAEKKEQERLSKLSEEERKKAELDAKEKALAKQTKELQAKELKLEMVKVLAERNLPVQFMDYLIDKDNESTLKRITEFEKEFKKAVENAVNEKLKGKAPAASGSAPSLDGNQSGKNGFFETILKNQAKR